MELKSEQITFLSTLGEMLDETAATVIQDVKLSLRLGWPLVATHAVASELYMMRTIHVRRGVNHNYYWI